MDEFCPMKFGMPQERGAYDQPVDPSWNCEGAMCAWWVAVEDGSGEAGMCAIKAKVLL